MRVDERRVVVLPAWLVLFGTAVVVDSHDGRAEGFGSGAEEDRRLSAVGADLDAEVRRIRLGEILSGDLEECLRLVERHETGRVVCDLASGGRGG